MSVSPKTVPVALDPALEDLKESGPPESTAAQPEEQEVVPQRSDGPFVIPPPAAVLAGTAGTIMPNATEQAVSNANMPTPPSLSSMDSGYHTGVSMTYSIDTSEPRSSSYPNTLGPTRTFSMNKQQPKQGPPQSVPDLRPSNETRQACVPCRRKKIGCDLRQPGNNYDPPCQRCRTENIRCFFTGSETIANSASSPSLPSLSQLACPHCSLVFLREDDLRIHLRTQCTEKHYVCQTCSSRFRRLNDLDRHARIHTGERPHTCDICKRRFSRATTLTRHRQGPDGCAGRRADLGRRRLGSFQGPPPEETTDTMLLTQPRYS